jgi:hypothetical protein
MTVANNRYLDLERHLVRGRALGTLSEAEDDRLLEQMDDLWWEMTAEECDAANRRAAEDARRQSAVGTLVLCDVQTTPDTQSSIWNVASELTHSMMSFAAAASLVVAIAVPSRQPTVHRAKMDFRVATTSSSFSLRAEGWK